jgi:Uma2 family endonuclease
MTSMAVARQMTVAEYLEHNHERWSSLIDGEVVVNQPRPLHQDVLGDVFVALKLWVGAAPGRGQTTLPLDIELDEHNCFAPDVLWYRAGREPGRSLIRPQPLPDIAAEIRSPSTWRHDIGAKKARYERHGLPELWLVDTAADEIIVFRRSTPRTQIFDVSLELARGHMLTSPLLPGFALALDELFGERRA